MPRTVGTSHRLQALTLFILNTFMPHFGELAGHITVFMKLKGIVKSAIAVLVIAGAAVMAQSFTSAEPSSTEATQSPKFVKTNARCNKCGCSGYRGYKHMNGTFEGACSNGDGHGHTCGHSPEHHGLRSW